MAVSVPLVAVVVAVVVRIVIVVEVVVAVLVPVVSVIVVMVVVAVWVADVAVVVVVVVAAFVVVALVVVVAEVVVVLEVVEPPMVSCTQMVPAMGYAVVVPEQSQPAPSCSACLVAPKPTTLILVLPLLLSFLSSAPKRTRKCALKFELFMYV